MCRALPFLTLGHQGSKRFGVCEAMLGGLLSTRLPGIGWGPGQVPQAALGARSRRLPGGWDQSRPLFSQPAWVFTPMPLDGRGDKKGRKERLLWQHITALPGTRGEFPTRKICLRLGIKIRFLILAMRTFLCPSGVDKIPWLPNCQEGKPTIGWAAM